MNLYLSRNETFSLVVTCIQHLLTCHPHNMKTGSDNRFLSHINMLLNKLCLPLHPKSGMSSQYPKHHLKPFLPFKNTIETALLLNIQQYVTYQDPEVKRAHTWQHAHVLIRFCAPTPPIPFAAAQQTAPVVPGAVAGGVCSRPDSAGQLRPSALGRLSTSPAAPSLDSTAPKWHQQSCDSSCSHVMLAVVMWHYKGSYLYIKIKRTPLLLF